MAATDSSSTRLSLISRIRANDSQAWQDLVALYSPLVAFWCRKQTVGESEINDAVQEVFFSVSRSIDDYRPRESGGGFRAWLWTITRHKIIDAKRRDARFPPAQGGSTALHASQQLPEELDEDEDSERFEFTQLLHRGLAQVESEFEPKTWHAFWRCTVDGQPVAVVATELEISASTVRQHRSRVLRRLRQQLGDRVFEGGNGNSES
ncbi:RNA polymerase sigma factor [Aureliella helgolandensis]|uniref:ECF RNA polymerase sigma factor SigE n=1 Tax=Aureliella helgolandensis TaxID=2527968 RepID=A0A518GCF3_9BACT|nr:sigma-70 family RNA polymerase sigma factor [Aureliella helgolandensis]QDV26275.1 ECF RNA polymerase sigma factor SigE [Aureliella helgolandensis]